MARLSAALRSSIQERYAVWRGFKPSVICRVIRGDV